MSQRKGPGCSGPGVVSVPWTTLIRLRLSETVLEPGMGVSLMAMPPGVSGLYDL